MKQLLQAAVALQAMLQAEQLPFCFIGGIALARWGEPRLTRDLDITLLAGFGNEERIATRLLELFPSRIADPLPFAIEQRVLLLTVGESVPVDIALGGLPFEEECVARASSYAYTSAWSLFTCSAEDLVIMKAFASRAQDWIDVEGILIRQKKSLDWRYIMEQLTPLVEVKEDPSIMRKLTEINNRVGSSSRE